MESRDVRRDEGRTKEDKMGEDTKMIKVEGKQERKEEKNEEKK